MSTRTASEVREELRHARQADRLHVAYLLEGPTGTGKSDVAHWFARLLLCHAKQADPCEACSACRKSRLDPTSDVPLHADWQRLVPDGASFKIEQVRTLQRALSLTPQEGGRRVGLLLGAEALTLAAANALLKTLEEPPRGTTLVLVARSGDSLPSTIRSRTLRLRFRAERADAIAAALEAAGSDPTDAWLAASLAGGSVPAARSWAEANLEMARELWTRIRDMPRASSADLLALSETFRGGGDAVRARTAMFLDVYEALMQTELRRAAQSSGSAAAAALPTWLARAERVAKARREWQRRNLNPQLMVEDLLFALRA